MYSIKKLYKIGPGPSSSHTMGPRNAVRYLLKYYEQADFYEVTLCGSLALTGKGHLSDKIIDETFGDIPHSITFDLTKFDLPHPNTMYFKLKYASGEVKEFTILSIGGGLIDIVGVPDKKYVHTYPHKNFDEIKKYCFDNNLSLVEYINHFEDDNIDEYIENIYQVMMETINKGLNKDGELPGDLRVKRKAKEIFESGTPEENAIRKEKRLISAYAFAVSEENASGGMVVTAPTCGACGIIPSLVRYYEEQGYSHKSIIDALKVAGLFGLLIKHNASISGAECGCQAEVGAAISMGAAFVSQLRGKSIILIERAAEIAMEHSLGLTCDPINGYVQIPCIERNAIGALRAIEASTLTDFIDSTSSKISFDLVIETMYETGRDLSKKYRETSMGGLAKKYKVL